MDGTLGTVAALVCGVAAIYVVVMRTMRKREQEALDAEAGEAMQKVADKAA